MGNCTNGKASNPTKVPAATQERSQKKSKLRQEQRESADKIKAQKVEAKNAAVQQKSQSRLAKQEAIQTLKSTKEDLNSKVALIKKQISELSQFSKHQMVEGNTEMTKLALEKKLIFEEYLELIQKEKDGIEVAQQQVKASNDVQVAEKEQNQADKLLKDIEVMLNMANTQNGKLTEKDFGDNIQKQLNQIYEEKFKDDPLEIDRQYDALEAELTKKDVLKRKITSKNTTQHQKQNNTKDKEKEKVMEVKNVQEAVFEEVGQENGQIKKSDWIDDELDKLR